MVGRADDWIVDAVADLSTAVAVLSQDRVANGYALADLEPPSLPYTTVAVARQVGTPSVAACLLYCHPASTVIVTHGHPVGLAAIFARIDLPVATGVDLPIAHRPVFERFYTLVEPHERQLMVVNARTFRSPSPSVDVTRLGPADLASALQLYAAYPENVFTPDKLEHGVFYGVWESDRLVAAGGTHVIAPRAGLAVVGNVFSRPEVRRRGYGTAITAAVVTELIVRQCEDICLNVDVANREAIGIYERLGFGTRSRRWQGRAVRRGA